MIEYWREIVLVIGGCVTFIVGRKSTKLSEKIQEVSAVDAMQKTYDVFLKHYKDQYDQLLSRLDNLELRNSVLAEASESWEKKFNELTNHHEKLKREFEIYKKSNK